MKNGRFSEKNVSNALRLTSAGSASTWPKSAEFIDRDFAGGPETDKRMICHDNVAKLYGFEV